MSLAYPNTINVTRQSTPKTPNAGTAGVVAYGGADPDFETLIAQNLPASIQFDRLGSMNPNNLPTDAPLPSYIVLIPQGVAPYGTINRNDIITDELGNRYLVTANYYNAGYNIRARQMAV